MGETTASDSPSFESLRRGVRGTVLVPGADGYDDARRVWNGTIDRRPAAIVRCTGVADVGRAVTYARRNDVPMSVKSGGHGLPGHAVRDDGLVVDVSPMNGVRVDPETGAVHVSGGATWGDVTHETAVFGIATAGTGRPNIGVAGFTLGGGIGPLSRPFGLAVDDLKRADVVTADGELVRASEQTNPDLFWALRGGGGNFGVVTSLVFESHDVPSTVRAGRFVYPIDAGADVLRTYREFMAAAPPEVASSVTVFRVGPDSPFPAALRDEVVIAVGLTHVGNLADDRPFERFRTDLEPVSEDVGPRSLADLERYDFVAGERNHWKTHFLDRLSDDAIETFLTYAAELPTRLTKVGFTAMGGAISAVDASATAFPHRDANHLLRITPQWSDPDRDAEIVAWAREFHDAMGEHATGGEFVNQQTDDGPERIEAAYGENLDRLVAVKNEWDPDNLFDANQNVEPTE